MTTNINRAAAIIDRLRLDSGPGGVSTAEHIARRLADAGLLMPDLQEANDPTASFVPGGKGWLLQGQTGPVVWTATGGMVMIQRLEPGYLTPAKAREFATHLLAAANHAEGDGCADA